MYFDAIAPLFGTEEERKTRLDLMTEQAWRAAVVDVARTWEYPFALPPPQMLIEAARSAHARLMPNPRLRTEDEREEARRIAAAGLVKIQAKLAESGAKLLPHQLPVRQMQPALSSGEIHLTDAEWDARVALLMRQGEELLAKYPATDVVKPSAEKQHEVNELAERVVEATK